MKTLPLLLLLLVQTITAQKLSKDDLSEKLADKACECASKKELTKDNFDVSLGLCIIESLGGYSKDVEKYYGKNAITNEEKLEELAANIGVKMATKCPKIFNMLSFDNEDSEEDMEEASLMISGKVTEIKQDQFITFSVKESSGKMNHFILLGDFDNAFLLTDKVLKVADEAEFYYYELDLYDAKLGRFVLYNIVSDIIKK
jgi:hypothetical protein